MYQFGHLLAEQKANVSAQETMTLFGKKGMFMMALVSTETQKHMGGKL